MTTTRAVPEHRSDAWVFVAYWVVASPFILSSFGDDGDGWTPAVIAGHYAYMVAAYSAAAWGIANVVLPRTLRERPRGLRYFAAMTAMLGVLLAVSTGTYLLEVWAWDTTHTWWHATLYWNLGNDAQNVLTIVAVLAAKKFFSERRRNAELQSERRQAELQRLRAQVDPHFLFNSLNILDVLIEDDPAEARAFVHRLSSLYRYLIRHRDEDLVPAAEELAHARDYHYLVRQRFGDAFRFRENLSEVDLVGHYVPPGSLQTVLENVYKHNLATERSPVTVAVEARDGALVVTNEFSPKPGHLATHEHSGSGATNLLRRYALLTREEVYSRREGDQWVARLPLLRVAELWPLRRPGPPLALTATSTATSGAAPGVP